jgi:hypothetical protein
LKDGPSQLSHLWRTESRNDGAVSDLDQHPDVFMSRPKETFFFNTHFDKGIEWFASHFEGRSGEHAIGEGTPWTMSAPEAPARVATHLPEARLIFILRNPIERAHSQYYFYVYTGRVEPDVAFHEAIRDEHSTFGQDMLACGMYDEQLERFEEYFDRSQMKIILHEDLRERTGEVVQDVYRFLDVDSGFEPDLAARPNSTHYPNSRSAYYWIRRLWQPLRRTADRWFPETADALRSAVRSLLFSEEKPAMRDDDRAYLRDLYAEPNARLEKRIGRDLSHWT